MRHSLILLALLQSTLLALAQVALKFALARMAPFGWTKHFWQSVLLNWQFALSGVFFTSASLLWVYMLKHYPLSQAYPMISLSYVMGMLAAIVFFHENVNYIQWLGVLLIVAGCALIAQQT